MGDGIGPGPRNLITDVEGFRVGNAEDLRVKTGVTVLTADAPFTAAVSVMGGAPGTRDTECLAPDKLVREVDALVLSGGSAFGLDATGGVLSRLAAAGRGMSFGRTTVPLAPGAILFDLMNGGDKNWRRPPYWDLGAAAYDQVAEDFQLGTAGAGVGATTFGWKGGLGSASLALPGGVMVGALVAVNAVGGVTAPGQRHFWAGAFEIGDEFGGLGPPPAVVASADTFLSKVQHLQPGANTTIAIVATNAALDQADLTRVATAAQDGLARAVVPAHTPFDGDLVFAASTGAVDVADRRRDGYVIGHAAALCLTRAIARGVFEATPAEADTFPCYRS